MSLFKALGYFQDNGTLAIKEQATSWKTLRALCTLRMPCISIPSHPQKVFAMKIQGRVED